MIRDGHYAMTIEIKILQRGDEAILMNVAPEVFDNPLNADLTIDEMGGYSFPLMDTTE